MTVSLVSGGYHAPIGSPSLYLSCSLPLLWQSQGFLVLQSSRFTIHTTSYEIRMDPPYLPSPKGYVKIRTPQNDISLSILSADFSPAPTDSNETERELSNQAGIYPLETKFNNLKTNLLHTTTVFLTSRKGHALIFVSSPCCFCRRML